MQKITVGPETETYEVIVSVANPGSYKFMFGFGKSGSDPVPSEAR